MTAKFDISITNLALIYVDLCKQSDTFSPTCSRKPPFFEFSPELCNLIPKFFWGKFWLPSSTVVSANRAQFNQFVLRLSSIEILIRCDIYNNSSSNKVILDSIRQNLDLNSDANFCNWASVWSQFSSLNSYASWILRYCFIQNLRIQYFFYMYVFLLVLYMLYMIKL